MAKKDQEKVNFLEPEETNESKTRLVKNGHTYKVVLTWRGKTYMVQMFVPSVSRPTRLQIEKEVQKLYPDAKVMSFLPRDLEPGEPTVMMGEELDKNDKPFVKKLVGKLRKGSKTHAKQADDLEKAVNEGVKRDEYGDPIGGPKISKKQLKKNLAANTPDEDHTNTTAEGYGSDRVGPALTMARAIDKVNPRPKPNSKRTMASRALKMASIKKDEKIRKRKENPYSTDKKLKMVASSIRDRVKRKVKSMAANEDYIPEEGYDIARDMGRVRPSKDKKDATTMPPSKEMKKTQKVNKGPSALEIVKKKYGKAVMDIKK